MAALERGDDRAQSVIDIYRLIYAIEKRATLAEMTAAERLVLRQRETVPLWERLEAEIARIAPQAGKKSPLGRAVTSNDSESCSLRPLKSSRRGPACGPAGPAAALFQAAASLPEGLSH